MNRRSVVPFYRRPILGPVSFRSQKPRKRSAQDFVSSLWNVFRRLLSDPKLALFVVFSVSVAISHVKYDNDSIIDQAVKYLKEHTATSDIGAFLEKYERRIVGALCFLPVVLLSPNSFRMFLFLGVLSWVTLAPEMSILQYSLQALLTLLYVRMTGSDHRMFIIIASVLLYLGGFIFTSTESSSSRNPTVEASQTATPRTPVPTG
jgi:hypothetical protein